MPTYVYRCKVCESDFETVQKFSDAPLEVCPHGHVGVRRVVTAAGIIFKGSGWYVKDKNSDSGGSKSKSSGADNSTTDSSGTDSSGTDSRASSDTTTKSESSTVSEKSDKPEPKPASTESSASEVKA